MTSPQNNDDYDTPWKTAVESYFPEFMAFYFPNADKQIDWQRGFQFLDQELAQVVKDAEVGKRILDKLAKVFTFAGGEVWILIHIEIQNNFEAKFSERLYIYNYRLFDKYQHQIVTLAILTDDDANWRPEHYGYDLLDFKIDVNFPIVKLIDFQSQIEELQQNPNAFAIVTIAHLLTRQTRHEPQQRYDAKLYLAKLLYQRNWDKQRIINLFSVIDWMMQVPEALQYKLWHEIEQFERNLTMPYITSVERIGIEKGKEIGFLQGMLEGKLEGKQEEAAAMLQRLISRRFGPAKLEVVKRIEAAPHEQIEHWIDNFVEAKIIEDIFKNND
jgi:hypothetical protein